MIATYTDAASEFIRSICAEIGVAPGLVRSITVSAIGCVDVEVYEVNEDGRKFCRPGGDVALAHRTLPYRYSD